MPVSEAATGKLIGELELARRESDRLFTTIKPGSIFERPINARHRVIFYIGHLDGFDFIQICREGLGIQSPDSALDDLFQAGIDPDVSNLPTDTPADWPSLDQVRSYVGRCRKLVDGYLEQAPEEVVSMALEHRLMHLETLAYMFHNFAYDLKIPPESDVQKESSFEQTPTNPWCQIPAGEAVLGRKRGDSFGQKRGDSFGWDNEFEETRSPVPGFRIQQHSVTNGEYLKFVLQGAPLPHFWSRRGNAIYYRGMFQEHPLPLDWPVYVTQEQARAYADWCGFSLPTEEQFHRAAYGTDSLEQRSYPWGDSAPAAARGNFDFRRWDPESVFAKLDGNSFFGVSELVGNGWEWTRTPFGPFPGFKPFPTYPGYSTNFFDGEHFVLKGASPRTANRLLRSSFRNWFRPDYPYVYAKFRCIENSGE